MTETRDTLLDRLGHLLARYLRSESSGYKPYTPSDFRTLCATLRPADILLVEGNQKISTAIKYLTQPTWSYAAMFIGDRLEEPGSAIREVGGPPKASRATKSDCRPVIGRFNKAES